MGALALPLVLPGAYHRHLLVLAGLFVLMALGFDLVLGYLGELSLGHAAFFGVGAYTTALLTRNFATPFPLDLAARRRWSTGVVRVPRSAFHPCV